MKKKYKQLLTYIKVSLVSDDMYRVQHWCVNPWHVRAKQNVTVLGCTRTYVCPSTSLSVTTCNKLAKDGYQQVEYKMAQYCVQELWRENQANKPICSIRFCVP
jgi:hypothetical protein